MKKRVSQYMVSADCPVCAASGCARESLSVTFAGLDIAELLAAAARSALGRRSLRAVRRTRDARRRLAHEWRRRESSARRRSWRSGSPRICVARLAMLLDLGLGYLSLERSTPTLSPGELQRLRLATQVRSNLFGVVYVLDEPSAGLHPADTEALLRALDRLKAVGQLAVRRRARARRDPPRRLDRRRRARRRRARRRDPLQRPAGGAARASRHRRPRAHLFARPAGAARAHAAHADAAGCSSPASRATTCTSSTSPFRSACSPPSPACRARASRAWSARRSSSWSRAQLGHAPPPSRRTTRPAERARRPIATARPHRRRARAASAGWCASTRSRSAARRARTSPPTPGSSTTCASCSPRRRRRARAATTPAASRSTSPRGAARPARARASSCVELLFLPSVYAPCPTCHGARYNAEDARGARIATRTSPTCSA